MNILFFQMMNTFNFIKMGLLWIPCEEFDPCTCLNFRYNDELRQEIQKLSADLHKYKQASKVVKTEVSCQVSEQDLKTGS